jgi:hypothetical protein
MKIDGNAWRGDSEIKRHAENRSGEHSFFMPVILEGA